MINEARYGDELPLVGLERAFGGDCERSDPGFQPVTARKDMTHAIHRGRRGHGARRGCTLAAAGSAWRIANEVTSLSLKYAQALRFRLPRLL